MSEVVEAQAVTLADQLDLARRGFEDVRAKVADKLAEYEGATITDEESYKAMKRYRADVRKLMGEVDAAKKACTKQYKDAIKEFEAQVRELTAPLDRMQSDMGCEVTSWEARKREMRREHLRALYESAYPQLAQLAPFERIDAMHISGERDWYKASVSEKRAEGWLSEDADRLARDEQTLDNLDMSDEERRECKASLFETLDIGAAIDAVKRRRAEEAQRQAQMERVAQMESERFEQAYAAQHQQEPQTPATAPQSVSQPTQRELWLLFNAQAIPEERRVKVEGITTQTRDELVRIFKAIGLKGKFYRE